MIVIDTSALMAILLGEPSRGACLDALARHPDRVMSVGTLAEAYIVGIGRDLGPLVVELVSELKVSILPMTADFAYQAGEAYRQWGKGRHRASLNYGDCFSYAAAMSLNAPLLFIGDDFSQTDIRSVL